MISPHLYKQGGIEAGVSLAAVDRSLRERMRLANQGAYPLLTLGHFAHETGASYSYLREVVMRTRDPYQEISVPKQRGGTREISAPEPILMGVQKWLLKNVLTRVRTHSASFAYEQDLSIVDCANRHLGSRWLLKMDLHNFFGTINEASVYREFRRLGYGKLISFELARVATRAKGAQRAPWLAATQTIASYSVDRVGFLPQGAPTSGVLANAVARKLDVALQNLADDFELSYTRYSDDLVFSSNRRFERSYAENIIKQASGSVRRAGFLVHRGKTRVVPPGARKIVLGLLVGEELHLLPDHRRRIEMHLRGCEKFGLARHSAHRGFDSPFSFINHLGGWISFAIGVERERALVWRQRLHDLLEREGLPGANARI